MELTPGRYECPFAEGGEFHEIDVEAGGRHWCPRCRKGGRDWRVYVALLRERIAREAEWLESQP